MKKKFPMKKKTHEEKEDDKKSTADEELVDEQLSFNFDELIDHDGLDNKGGGHD